MLLCRVWLTSKINPFVPPKLSQSSNRLRRRLMAAQIQWALRKLIGKITRSFVNRSTCSKTIRLSSLLLVRAWHTTSVRTSVQIQCQKENALFWSSSWQLNGHHHYRNASWRSSRNNGRCKTWSALPRPSCLSTWPSYHRSWPARRSAIGLVWAALDLELCKTLQVYRGPFRALSVRRAPMKRVGLNVFRPMKVWLDSKDLTYCFRLLPGEFTAPLSDLWWGLRPTQTQANQQVRKHIFGWRRAKERITCLSGAT